MTVFVCIDERGGMLFNSRRQSRDAILIADVCHEVGDGLLYISDFSEKLFEESEASAISVTSPLEAAGEDDFVFVENPPLGPYLHKIKRLIIYNWNKKYPCDTALDVIPESAGFKKAHSTDFVGKSHDKITKEVFTK